MNIAETEVGVQLCNFVGTIAAVFVRLSDIFHTDPCLFDCRRTIAVFGVADDSHIIN